MFIKKILKKTSKRTKKQAFNDTVYYWITNALINNREE